MWGKVDLLSIKDYDNVLFSEWPGSECDNYDSDVYLYILDPADNNQTFSWTYFLWDQCESGDGGKNDHITQPKLAAGELDGDGQDEIGLTTSGPAAYRGFLITFNFDIRKNGFLTINNKNN